MSCGLCVWPMLSPGRGGQGSPGGGGVSGGRISGRRQAGPWRRGRPVTQPGKCCGPRRSSPGRRASSSFRRRDPVGGWRGPAGGQAVGRVGSSPRTQVSPCSRRRKPPTRSPGVKRRPSSPGGPGMRWPGCGGPPWRGRARSVREPLGGARSRENGAGVRARLRRGVRGRWLPHCPADQRAPAWPPEAPWCSVTALALTHAPPQGQRPRPRLHFLAHLPTPDPRLPRR